MYVGLCRAVVRALIYGDCIETGVVCLSTLRRGGSLLKAHDGVFDVSWFAVMALFWVHFDHFAISDRAMLQARLACRRYGAQLILRGVQFMASSTLVQSFWGNFVTHPQPPALALRAKTVQWLRPLRSLLLLRRRWFIGRWWPV